jgi:hypothetical protein
MISRKGWSTVVGEVAIQKLPNNGRVMLTISVMDGPALEAEVSQLQMEQLIDGEELRPIALRLCMFEGTSP